MTLFLQGGLNSLTDLKKADSSNNSGDNKLWIAAAIIVPLVFIIILVITCICIFTCCTKIKVKDGKSQRVCRKATSKCTCLSKKKHDHAKTKVHNKNNSNNFDNHNKVNNINNGYTNN